MSCIACGLGEGLDMTEYEEIIRKLGIENAPGCWQTHWNDFQQWKTDQKCVGMDGISDEAVRVFNLPAEALPDLKQTFEMVRSDADLIELVRLWHYLMLHIPRPEDYPNTWPLPEKQLGELAPLFWPIVMISGMNDALANYERIGVSRDIAESTLGLVGIYVDTYHERYGKWGMMYPGWLHYHIHANIFHFHKLSFKPSIYNWHFRAYKNHRTSEIISLLGSGNYRGDGLVDGINDITDPEAWTAALEIDKDRATGHPVTKNGRAVRKPITLYLNEWEPVLVPGDNIIEVHIPGRSKLTEEECARSYSQALEFFRKRSPEIDFKAFTCWSWLLDPGLAEILPAESNIVQFQRPYHRLPIPGGASQAYDLVFWNSNIDLTKAPRDTALRRGIIDYVAAGNQLRATAGFILVEG